MKPDYGRAAADYGRHRLGFPEAFFERIFANGYVKSADNVLDIGTGTGALAREFARRGCCVTALDPSEALLAESARLDRDAGISAIKYVNARAEETLLPDDSFDVVTAGQCWHWFDRNAAANEVRRVLRPAGRVLIAHRDEIPLPGNVMEATEGLIVKYNPEAQFMCGGSGVHAYALMHLSAAGFENIETFSFDVNRSYSHEAWRGRVRTHGGVGGSLPANKVPEFDAALASLLKERFPEEPLIVLHRIWSVTATSGKSKIS